MNTLNQNNVQIKPTGGLLNTGNTCYLNTTIACLSFLNPFKEMILEKKWTPQGEKSGFALEETLLIDELYDLVQDLWSKKHSLIPKKFLKSVSNNIKELDLSEQNDIHEFIVLFLNKIHENISNPTKITRQEALNKSSYKNTKYDSQRLKMDTSWYESHKKEWSLLIDMFWGQTVTQIQCGNCQNLTHNYEIYHNIMLTMQNCENSLEDCLDTYFDKEVLDEWRCDRCQQKSNSVKTGKLWRIPKILIISLKRFDHNLNKSNQMIKIPEELDLSKWSLSTQTYPMKYQLCSIAYHIGNFSGGHYYAIGKFYDNWWKIDDLSITMESNPNFQSGYVFFYHLI